MSIRFWLFWGVQFLGAFNDILFKKIQQYFENLSQTASKNDIVVVPDAGEEVEESQKYIDYKVKVRRKNLVEMAPISVQEAVQHLELLELPAYLFRNVDNGNQIQMIYKENGEYVLVVPPQG